MAKSRAQRKAEQRKRQAQQGSQPQGPASEPARSQHDTQVPESADVAEAELAARGANLDELKGEPVEEPQAPAPSRGEIAEPKDKRVTRREQKRLERERRDAAKASVERRKPREAPVEKERGRVLGFFASCVAELRRVQWPTRDTLIQASAVTVVFIAVAAVYLGVLDAAFNWVVQRVL